MNDTQPKPTGEGMPGGYGKPWRVPTGEWTAESVAEIGGGYSTTSLRNRAIADAHNAAIASARQPLMDALKRIAEGAGETLHGYEPAEIAKGALEKVEK